MRLNFRNISLLLSTNECRSIKWYLIEVLRIVLFSLTFSSVFYFTHIGHSPRIPSAPHSRATYNETTTSAYENDERDETDNETHEETQDEETQDEETYSETHGCTYSGRKE